MDYRTIEGVTEIFRNVNCIGEDNCFFITYKNTNRASFKYVTGGALGALAAGMVEGMENADGFLINATENGLGIIPMKGPTFVLKVVPSKMEPEIDKFIFVKNEDIEDIEIKNFNIFNKKIQKVNITLKGQSTFYQLANLTDKDIPYHEANFNKFMSKYKK